MTVIVCRWMDRTAGVAWEVVIDSLKSMSSSFGRIIHVVGITLGVDWICDV